MASDADNIRTAISARLAEIATGALKPSYSINGQSVDWQTYRRSLLEEVRELRAMLASFEGPIEEETQGFI